MKNFFRTIGIFIAILFSSSCGKNFQEIALETSKIAEKQGMKQKVYHTKNFKVFTLQRINNPLKSIRIYFEGDGRAFLNRHVPSMNPTPTSFFLINLIEEDDYDNIVYIARPCQYVFDSKCSEKYWTTDRFSKEIIDSINEVIRNFSDSNLELVGYSGGATIAKYIATKNSNVVSLRTIAGNIDQQKFTEIHNVSPLINSWPEINKKLSEMPQVHFVGEKDKIIPSIVSKSYFNKLPKKNCTTIVMIKDATHSKGWKKQWKKLLKVRPICAK